ncbi:hypothetical protein sr16176 [Sporisorium reilianum SRZ2]|uniref:Uncharacterized protein n=1 Tax=Sporisorium reilianum (strain SRZ2) TaxID=999809 RepID=E6ZRP9_SPORE|nr:hypothetical protein sr16176 [Sporisorium reilianum SRZ2]
MWSSAQATPEIGYVSTSNIADFEGHHAEDWLRYFERFCLDRHIEDDSVRKAKYFKTFMALDTIDWYWSRDELIRQDYDALVDAFLEHFGTGSSYDGTPMFYIRAFQAEFSKKKTVESLRRQESWRRWLFHVLNLSGEEGCYFTVDDGEKASVR